MTAGALAKWSGAGTGHLDGWLRLALSERTRVEGRCLRRPDVDAIVESQVDVVDVGDPLVDGGREFEIRLDARQELILADVDHGRVAR